MTSSDPRIELARESVLCQYDADAYLLVKEVIDAFLAALSDEELCIVPSILIAPFIAPLEDLDDCEPGLRAEDDMAMETALHAYQQPTVGDMRRLAAALTATEPKSK
jgi:hypothetical protein